MNLLELSIFTSAWIIGFKIATDTGMILSELGVILERLCNKYPVIMKPVYGCHYCMASLYSVISYSLFWHYSLNSLYELPLMIFVVCCFNGLFHNVAYREWQ
jgi:hypothetical protein